MWYDSSEDITCDTCATMLRWIKKKCKRTKKQSSHGNAELSCHEGIDFHIYEELSSPAQQKVELAYSIVSLVDRMDSKQHKKSHHIHVPSSLSEVICSLCEKPLPGVYDIPENSTCRCSGLSSFRSSDCSSSDKFSWLDYDCDEETDLRRRHCDLESMQNRLETEPRFRQPIYLTCFPGEENERRFHSDDSGGFFDTDNSCHSTDSSLDDSVVNNLDSLDLADLNDSTISHRLSQTPKMGCRAIRRTHSAHDSLGSGRRTAIERPSHLLTPSKISQPVPVCGIHRSTDKSTLLRNSLKRRMIQPESKCGQYASIRRGLQSYGLKEEDMGYDPASTDEDEICINVADILRSKKSRGRKCLMNQFSDMDSSGPVFNDMNKHCEYFV
ncbi:hypothetical protein LOTGIDRAFT_155976 [Lottia gigantea]|uniref:Uncharacterized protein n=1 Tax=Lottia gigantea TaxID=225164 RepID=V4AKM2_LOTGI|nr:hypothetical protein LOTGIDRAFT_155976 [Lottia gigantea]ESP04754.1 hypothetical protein LOTGIDRAFT_155976 [Lottia gigantea]